MRKLIPLIAATLVIAALAALAASALLGDRRAIARAVVEAQALTRERDSLLAVVTESERQRAALALERQRRETVIAGLLDSLTALERDRARAQLTVREIRTTSALMDRLRAAFPELGDSAWGLTTVPLEPGDTVGIEYLMVPAWFAETFAIDRANAASWRAQKDGLASVDSLRLAVTALQDSIARLEQAAARAYRAGYQSAYDSYGALSRRYIAELERPRFRLGSALGFILGAGTGVIVAELVHR
jgi:hypothetical protein